MYFTGKFDEDSSVIQCHNACIVTKSFVDVDDISGYLREAVLQKKFMRTANIKIYTGAHGLSDGELTEADEKT